MIYYRGYKETLGTTKAKTQKYRRTTILKKNLHVLISYYSSFQNNAA